MLGVTARCIVTDSDGDFSALYTGFHHLSCATLWLKLPGIEL